MSLAHPSIYQLQNNKSSSHPDARYPLHSYALPYENKLDRPEGLLFFKTDLGTMILI